MSKRVSHFKMGPANVAMTTRRSKGTGCLGFLIGFVFCSIFFLIGALLIWIGLLGPGLGVLLSQSWVETPCTVLSSELVGKDTVQVAIRYEYRFEEQTYEGDRYSFFNMKTNAGKAAKQKIVEEYAVGEQKVCYVDPEQPDQSVLNREFHTEMLFGLMGVPFAAIGLIGLVALSRSSRKKPVEDADNAPDLFENEEVQNNESLNRIVRALNPDMVTGFGDFSEKALMETPGPLVLKTDSSRIGGFIGLLFFAVIWNGVVFFIAAFRFSDWMQGKWAWFPELILLFFGLIGLLIILGTIHSFLGLFNPVPVLTLSRSLIPLGGSASLNWHFEGSAQSIRSLKITLQAIERVTYTRGTTTTTEESPFHETVLLETTEHAEISQGTVDVSIPSDSVHSFDAPRNKVIWRLNVQGSIPRWPDVTGSFPFRVVPHE